MATEQLTGNAARGDDLAWVALTVVGNRIEGAQGEAKLELKARLGRSKTLAALPVAVEAADKLTDAQVVARVKEHFRIDA